MIVYQLACGQGHRFEGWFASAEACERQAEAGQLLCPSCSGSDVRKLPSAPYVKGSAGHAAPDAGESARLRGRAMAALRSYLLANTSDVGRKFAEVARRIHYREEEARDIRGLVTPDEAVELAEEGIEAYALPGDILPSGEVH